MNGIKAFKLTRISKSCSAHSCNACFIVDINNAQSWTLIKCMIGGRECCRKSIFLLAGFDDKMMKWKNHHQRKEVRRNQGIQIHFLCFCCLLLVLNIIYLPLESIEKFSIANFSFQIIKYYVEIKFDMSHPKQLFFCAWFKPQKDSNTSTSYDFFLALHTNSICCWHVDNFFNWRNRISSCYSCFYKGLQEINEIDQFKRVV